MALFTIENIYAENVNFLASDYVAGMVSPGALIGLAGAMQKRLCGGSPYKVAVLPVIHGIEISRGRTLGELRHVDQSLNDVTVVTEIPQDMPGLIRFSLIVELQDGDATEIQVQRFIESARFSGGQVSTDPIAPGRRITVRRYDGWGDVEVRRLPRGWAMMPLSGPVAQGDEEEWLGLLAARRAAMQKGRIVNMVPAGYRMLGFGAKQLDGARDGKTPHQFAEPLTGLSQSLSSRNPFFRSLPAQDLAAHAWTWSVAPGCPLRLYSPAYR